MAFLKIRHRNKAGYTGGKYHDSKAYHDVLSYIMNPIKVPSGYIGGIGVNPCNAEFEMTCLSQLFAQDKGVHLRHMILSFEPHELWKRRTDSLCMANYIAFQVAAFYGKNFQIVYAVHEDTPKPHIHFVMNTTNYHTGRKYNGDKADLHAFLNWIDEVLSAYGTHVELVKDDGNNLI